VGIEVTDKEVVEGLIVLDLGIEVTEKAELASKQDGIENEEANQVLVGPFLKGEWGVLRTAEHTLLGVPAQVELELAVLILRRAVRAYGHGVVEVILRRLQLDAELVLLEKFKGSEPVFVLDFSTGTQLEKQLDDTLVDEVVLLVFDVASQGQVQEGVPFEVLVIHMRAHTEENLHDVLLDAHDGVVKGSSSILVASHQFEMGSKRLLQEVDGNDPFLPLDRAVEAGEALARSLIEISLELVPQDVEDI